MKKKLDNAFVKCEKSHDDLKVMWDFFIEGEATEEELDNNIESVLNWLKSLEFRNMLSGEEDKLAP